jgi:beta-N-acetylhexosaminidase
MIAAGLPAVMVGHLAFPNVTGDEIPATLSRALLTDLLRGELGFQGVAVTDDLFMQGARTDGTPLDEVCFRAMQAGADILLVSQTPRDHAAIHRRLLEGMADPAFNIRVREAARRVITLKADYLKRPGAVPLNPQPDGIIVPAAGADEFFQQQAARSITLVKNGRFPIPPGEAGRVLLAGTHADFFAEGLKRYPDARTWRLEYAPTVSGLQSRGRGLLRTARDYDTVVAVLPDGEMGILLNELEEISDRVVVISVLSPAHLDRIPWVSTAIAAYGTGAMSYRAVFAALAGDFVPEGILPIPLDSVQ